MMGAGMNPTIDDTPTSADSDVARFVERANTALVAGDAELAAGFARAALARDPTSVPGLVALGASMEVLGDPAAAAAAYAEAARRAPRQPAPVSALRRLWAAPLIGFSIAAWVALVAFRTVMREFDQRTVLLALFFAAAALLLATLVSVWRRRRRFASLSRTDRTVLQAAARGWLRDEPIAPAIVGSLVVIGVLSAAAVLFAVGTKPTLSLAVGDCFTLTQRASIQQISAIPCELAHATEVYAVFTYPEASNAPYPGVDAVRSEPMPFCAAAYETYVGVPYTDRQFYWVSDMAPEQAYWDIGVRTAWCTLGARAGSQTTGTARGAHR
jgi:hypothetical protein